MKPFFLKSITIDKQCNLALRKALTPITYKLAEELPFPIYSKNISISAIVGMNGAGKSSLLDILFRLINNFSFFVIGSSVKRNAAEHIYFIPGLHASMEYTINGKDCLLISRGNGLGISQGNAKYYFSKNYKPIISFESEGYHLLQQPDFEMRKTILGDFFFSVVTNYSLQAFNSNDYQNEEAHEFVDGKRNSGTASFGNWMDSVFDKNDGYLMPLTFNPYRSRGKFDLESETQRTKARLSAILIQAKKKAQPVLEGYQLEDIHYEFDESSVGEKLYRYKPDNYKSYDVRIPSELYMRARSVYEEKNSFLHIILKTLKLDYVTDEYVRDNSCIYLGYKILSIAGKYPSYSEFASLGNPWLLFSIADKETKKSLEKLVKKVKADKSHIATKVHQTINYLEAFQEGKFIDEKFKYAEYELFVTKDKIKSRSVEGYIGILPPPIFKSNIYFNPIEKGLINTKQQIPLTHLSSGERQFLYMMSTLLYHIMNIKSVPTSRESYRHINLILDEIELCFHPEYQRKMVHWLVSVIKRLQINQHCAFNIILTTHSPFILSDIVPKNILYLEEGEPICVPLKTPFAANVNEILKQSFFLKDGFMGEYAKEKVISFIKYLTRGNADHGLWTKESAEAFLEMIGEPILRDKLRDLQK